MDNPPEGISGFPIGTTQVEQLPETGLATFVFHQSVIEPYHDVVMDHDVLFLFQFLLECKDFMQVVFMFRIAVFLVGFGQHRIQFKFSVGDAPVFLLARHEHANHFAHRF